MGVQAQTLSILSRLLDTALSLPANAREAWLAALAPEHAGLSETLRQLLAQADLGADDPFLSTLPKVGAPPAESSDLKPGDSLGAYRLERLLGSGGMGSVWLAMRTDSLQRSVALKLPHPEAASAGLAERMGRERNILAKLEHPNIARLYDAGVTPEGRPYLALEYVQGEAIDVYCRTHDLGVRPRVELLTQVARAVAYAHAHLVVHRDLKPSNVLVDGEGQVHLLDFGIAALLSPGENGGVVGEALTRRWGAALTPYYASPEQLRGDPVSTASDVYALGVLAYEVLTGRRPYQFKEGDLLAAMHAVIEIDPPPPSHAVSAVETRRRLRGDLDTIVLKAMHKQSQARYATALAFAEDLQHYLRAEPVRARPASLRYRAARFVQRHWVVALSIALIAITLCVGIAGTLWEGTRAVRGERQARAAEQLAVRRFEDVRNLTHSLLFDYYDAIKDLAGATPVRARLVRDSLGYLDRLAREAGRDVALQQELATAYQKLGEIQGDTMSANLGDTPGALESARKVLALRQQIATARPSDAAAHRDLALAHSRVGILLWELGEIGEARAEIEVALATLRAAPASQASDARSETAKAEDYMGRMFLEQGDSKHAREHFAASTTIVQALLREKPGAPALLRELSTLEEQTGGAADFEGDLDAALRYYEHARKLREQLSTGAPMNADYQRIVAVSWYDIGEVLAEQNKVRQALDAYRRDSAISQRLMRLDPTNQEYRGDLAYAQLRIGDMLLRSGANGQAIGAYRSSLELRAADVGADPTNLWKRSSLIEVHAKLGKAFGRDRPQQASAEADLARSLMEQTTLEPKNAAFLSFFATTYADLGDVYQEANAVARGRRADRDPLAREMYDHAEEIWRVMESRGMLNASDRKRREQLKVIRTGA